MCRLWSRATSANARFSTYENVNRTTFPPGDEREGTRAADGIAVASAFLVAWLIFTKIYYAVVMCATEITRLDNTLVERR
jgi:hypothetical protein